MSLPGPGSVGNHRGYTADFADFLHTGAVVHGHLKLSVGQGRAGVGGSDPIDDL